MGKTVLIVDDDRHILLALSIRLKAQGYRILIAPDSTSAMTTACLEIPDIVILDLGLPGDGFLVLEQIRATPTLSATPVIVLSGRDPAGNKRRAPLIFHVWRQG